MIANGLVARGMDWAALDIGIGWVYDGPVLAQGRDTTLNPYHLCAWLVRRGEVSVEGTEGRLTARKGQWLIPKPEAVRQRFSSDARILSVRFRAHWADGRPLFDEGLGLRFPAARYPEMERKARGLALAARRCHSLRPDLLGHADFTLDAFLGLQQRMLEFVKVFAAALQAQGVAPTRLGVRDERVLRAVGWLDRHPVSERFVEVDLARHVGLGASRFVRLFREEMGVTPKRYFEGLRRTAAKRLLAGSAMPLKEVGAAVGFRGAPDFSNWFKAVNGVSPGVFRRRLQVDAE